MSKVKKTMHSTKLVCVFFISIFFITATAPAEENHIRDGFWGGLDAGAGWVKQSFDEKNEDDIYFFLGFKGGYTINPHFLVGIELSGWLLETGEPNDLNSGKGISQVFLITQLYPSKEYGLFMKAGGGYVSN